MLHLLPIDAGKSPETLRRHTLQIGKRLADTATEKPPTGGAALTISLDSSFIRSREDGERHLAVRVGNVETAEGSRQVFGAAAKAETDINVLIRRALETLGRTDATDVTTFTDDCLDLQAVLAEVGLTKPLILDWFHIAMRLQHTKLAAAQLSSDNPERVLAKAAIVAESERLRWRTWNGGHALHAIDKLRDEVTQGVRCAIAIPANMEMFMPNRILGLAAIFCLMNVTIQAAVPNMLGTWVTEGDFVFAGTNNATHSWPKGSNATTTVIPKPSIVVTQQTDRHISGYVMSSTNRTPFHAIIKHSGTGLVGRGPYGILTADIDGDTIEWCFASTIPNVDAVACNMFRHQTNS